MNKMQEKLYKMIDESDGSLYNAMQYAHENNLLTVNQMEKLELAFDSIVWVKQLIEEGLKEVRDDFGIAKYE